MTTGQTFPQVFKLTGEVDLARRAELDAIAAAAAQIEFAIVDLAEVTFLDSTALNWLIGVKQCLEQKDGRLRVVAPPVGMVNRLLALAGLQGVIEVLPTRRDAVASLLRER